jgi:hypothetical protein
MIYEYTNEATGRVIEKDFPMADEHPITIFEDGLEFKRLFNNSSIHIPFQWGDIHANNIKFDKSPSGKKHFY